MIRVRNMQVWFMMIVVIMAGIISFQEVVFSAGVIKYPERDIVFICPFGPGGGGDLISRATAQFLRKYLPKSVNVIVQNVSTAGGRVGAFQIYDAKPDGYNIGLVVPDILIGAAAMGEMGNRDIMHLTWMERVSSQKYMIAVGSQSSIKTLQDIKGKRITASVSQSSIVTSVAFLRFLDAKPQAVMYAGGAEACLAAMRGDVDLVIQVVGTTMRQVEASGGRLIPLAVFLENRIATAPNVPTAKELGINLTEDIMALMSQEMIYLAPYGLPVDVHKVLSEAMGKTIRDPGFVEQLGRGKLTVDFLSSEGVQKYISGLSKVLPRYIEETRQALGK